MLNALIFTITNGTTTATCHVETNSTDLGKAKISFREDNPNVNTKTVGYTQEVLLPITKEACNYCMEYGITVTANEFEVIHFSQVS